MDKTLKQKVITILKENPDTRNSDITLMIEIWKRYYGVEDSIKLSQLYDLPREDNIKRIRAIIQNKNNMYLPSSPEVRKKRKIEERKWNEYLGYTPKLISEDQRMKREYMQTLGYN